MAVPSHVLIHVTAGDCSACINSKQSWSKISESLQKDGIEIVEVEYVSRSSGLDKNRFPLSLGKYVGWWPIVMAISKGTWENSMANKSNETLSLSPHIFNGVLSDDRKSGPTVSMVPGSEMQMLTAENIRTWLREKVHYNSIGNRSPIPVSTLPGKSSLVFPVTATAGTQDPGSCSGLQLLPSYGGVGCRW
jgi:hypothetical protein